MNNRRLLMTAISLCLGLTTLTVGGSKASGESPRVTAKAGGEPSPTQRRRGRRARGKDTTPRAKSFSKDLGELRAQFNRDKGRVRMLMLLSPT